MLKSLKLIFNNSIFKNSANDKYAWVGSEKAKMFLFIDFRWYNDLIPWCYMLLILEDEIYSEDIIISTGMAIFATSKSSIKHRGLYNASDDREMEMMAPRWKNYAFRHQFFPKEQKHLHTCPRRFAKLVFLY